MSILVSLIKDMFSRKPAADAVQALRQLEQAKEELKLDETIAHCQEILKADPTRADALFHLGAAFESKKWIEAIECYRMAIATDPKYYPPKISLMSYMQARCVWDGLKQDAQKMRRVVRETPVTDKNHLSPFKFLALPGTTADEQKRCAERYAQIEYPVEARAALRARLGFDFNRAPNKKIHLGYLSEDFGDHATAKLMAEIFELHNRDRFHVTAYSYGADDGSAMRRRLEKAFDRFVDVRGDSHEEAARKIYQDRTDILVDLKGYTLGTRSGITALRPAPIQVNYLGYPGTLGADFVDYLIADRFIIPPEHFGHYSEKVVWLPDCYQPNDRSRPHPPRPARSACGLPEQGFVFCSFNQTYKITPEVFDIWCRLLKAVPGSYLWLWMNNPHAERNLKQEAASRGVDPERVLAAPTINDTAQHLARLQCADLFLDTFPVNAHTTCGDALWMGLPVVTCAGETFPSRVAGSLLSAMGLSELITYDLESYYRLALELAQNPGRLAAIRDRVMAGRATSPLFDSGRFVRNLEDVYARMSSGAGAHRGPADGANGP